jgi:ligand-binding SRPBCC domain-containing protein
MPTIDLSTYLDAPPQAVWSAVKRSSTFEHITPGLPGFSVDGVPGETWAEEGATIGLRLRAFNRSLAWHHTINIVTVDEDRRLIQTQEHGGPVKRWNHTITVDEEGSGSRYRDHVEIDAGAATPAVWTFAQGLYRYRQNRLRQLARTSIT